MFAPSRGSSTPASVLLFKLKLLFGSKLLYESCEESGREAVYFKIVRPHRFCASRTLFWTTLAARNVIFAGNHIFSNFPICPPLGPPGLENPWYPVKGHGCNLKVPKTAEILKMSNVSIMCKTLSSPNISQFHFPRPLV